jgi:hypothetical protein
MGEGGDHAALACLAESLRKRGVEAHVREWPKGPVLSVIVNLAVQHSDGCYRWHEGLTDRQHPGSDPSGAAERIADLRRRLQGPSFIPQSMSSGGDER